MAPLLLLLLTLGLGSSHALRINVNTGGTAGGCLTDPAKCTKIDDGGGVPPLPEIPLKLSGALTILNCKPSTAPVVSLSGLAVTATGGTSSAASGAAYSYYFSHTYAKTSNPPGHTTITPSALASCSGGAWSPASLTATAPAAGQNFVYVKGTPIALDLIALSLTGYLRSAQLLLNNFDGRSGLKQTSFFSFGATKVALTIPKVTVDLDCGFFCPDLGDGYFYVSNMNMNSLKFSTLGNALVMTIGFKSKDIEIRGFHNVLGDGGVPDFQIDNAKFEIVATPIATTAGAGLTLSFGKSKLTADISSTGGCNVGIDLCNWILGTNSKIKTAMQNAADAALGSTMMKTALANAIKSYLATINIPKVSSFALYGGKAYVVL